MWPVYWRLFLALSSLNTSLSRRYGESKNMDTKTLKTVGLSAAGVLVAAAILSYGKDVAFIDKLREAFDR